jgi:hypothetical protein
LVHIAKGSTISHQLEFVAKIRDISPPALILHFKPVVGDADDDLVQPTDADIVHLAPSCDFV